MANSRQVKQRINTARNIAKITKAMEMVSASKMKRSQESALSARPYAQALEQSLKLLVNHQTKISHPLLSVHDQGKPALVIIATDRGLCGSLNQNLFKIAGNWLRKHEDGVFITVGKKAQSYAQYLGAQTLAVFTEIPDKVSTNDLVALSTLLIDSFTNKELKSIDLVYTDFVNTLSQQAKIVSFLPITPQQLSSEEVSLSSINQPTEFLFEPNPTDILYELLPFYVENTLFHCVLESKASEHSARMVAMKNASDNAKDLVKDLQLIFNKSRQESITSELLDITTAALSLSQ